MTRLKWLISIAVLVAIILIPLISKDKYLLYNITGIFIWGVMAISLLINIKTGIYNFSAAGFMLIGAYVTALMTTKLGVSFWLTLPAAAVVSVIIAVLIGLVVFRTKGMYFVLLTACLSQIFVLAVVNFPELTGGWGGIPNIPVPQLFNIDFTSRANYYWLSLVFLALAFLFCYRLWNSQIGKVYQFIGANDSLAQSVGIPLATFRVQSFAVSSLLFALSGCFLASYIGYIDPTMFSLFTNIEPWFYVIMGGTSSLLGPLLGAGVIRYLRVLFGFMVELAPISIGAIIILVIVFLPKGILGIPEKAVEIYEKLRPIAVKLRT